MHYQTLEQIYKKLEATPDGLSEKEAVFRLRKFGENRLPEEKKFTRFFVFFKQFKSPLIAILIIASLISLILGDYFDSAIIFAAVILNVVIAYFQEEKADKALAALKKMAVENALVFRDGYLKERPALEIVPGDVIFLKQGNKIPADARILETKNLAVNESVLTGEWLPIEKKADILPVETPLAERRNLVFKGTIVDSGEGKAVVTATGVRTEFGKIAASLAEQKIEPTPLQKKLISFSRSLTIFIVFFSSLIFLTGILRGTDFLSIFILSVALAVAAVPEGLSVGLTMILAIGMEKILEKGGLVKSLLAAETLGSATVICVDKTGTLTTGEMVVANVLTSGRELFSDNGKYGEKLDANGVESHILALKAAVLCNEAFIENPDDELKDWVIRGRMTDKALILAGIQAGLSKIDLEKQNKRLDVLPFDSVSKFQATLHRHYSDNNNNIIYAAGAPEAIIGISKFVSVDGREEISEKTFSDLARKYENLSKKGLRVVGVGYKLMPKTCERIDKNDLNDFVLIGFIALKDPLRQEAKEAIRTSQNAGIKVIMITGDHKYTAKAVAEELEIFAGDDEILEGNELEKMSDEELAGKIKKIKIFSRSSPHQKLRIVRALQENGEAVAMTGDGVNDAPALKKADIGVVLGSGTDVAKEIGDLVLINNSFSVIVSAIERGRIIFDNLKKIIVYLISDSFTEVMLISAALFFGMPSPLLPAQILWINLIEDSLPVFAMAFEGKEDGLMNLPPKGLKSSLWDAEVKTLILTVTLLNFSVLFLIYFWLGKNGFNLEYLRTIIFCGVGMNSLIYAFSCRKLRTPIWRTNPLENKFLVFSSVLGILALFAAVYVPFFQWILKTAPLGIFDWVLVFSIGALNIAAIEAVKYVFVNLRKS